MTIGVIAYCFFYLVLFIAGGIGIQRHFKKNKHKSTDNKRISLNEVTLITPFRNEEHRISPLLQSIENSPELPVQIIFVDDHSTDKTVEVIHSHLKNASFQIIHSQKEGKKNAIDTGIKNSATPYILTMDADVKFSEDYFSQIKSLSKADMHILPVKMTAKGWGQLFELDVYMVNGLNLIADGLKQPIAASGANLLFSKNAYETTNSLSAHSHVLSGDDQFLLADFVRNRKNIQLHSQNQFSVTTPAPNSLKELISQRLRWILKTPKVNDPFAMNIGVIQLLTTLCFLILSIWLLAKQQIALFMILFALKSVTDLFLVRPYFSGIKKQELFILIPVYEIILPIYTIVLAVIALFYKPSWKGRK